MKIGKLEEVELRELWKHEQHNFSEWLSKKENISELDNILGLSLTDIKKEVRAGVYHCDLVAVDETSGIKVVIENQLEVSDHDHLGKVITYASGLDAQVAVWIVKKAKEEHKSAIEWLNNNTDSSINFFLIELHACKIGTSLPAPYFEVIEKPNDFIKNNKVYGEQGNLNKTQSERLKFWEQLNEILINRKKPFNLRKATPRNWYDIAIGTSKAHITINLVNTKSVIYVDLYINNDKELYDYLHDNKDLIENEVGTKLIWERKDNGPASRIKYKIEGLNFNNQSNYEELINKTIDIVIKMRNVFERYL